MKRFILWSSFILIIVPLGLWLVYEPGSVTITWFGYRLETHAFIALFGLSWLLLSCVLLTRLWLWLRHTPQRILSQREQGKRHKSLQALTRGFISLAAGESQNALIEAETIDKNMPLPALSLLLKAQAHLQKGDHAEAKRHFVKMLESQDTVFFAHRGLAQHALHHEDYESALQHLREASSLQPKAHWIYHALLRVYTAQKKWHDVLTLVDKAHSAHAFPLEQSRHYQAVTYFMLADACRQEGPHQESDKERTYLEKSVKHDPHFVMAYVRKAQWERESQNKKKSLEAPEEQHYQTLHKLCQASLTSAQSRLAMADAAIRCRWWAQARHWLDPLFQQLPLCREALLYRAAIDKATMGHDKGAQWHHQAEKALPLFIWSCQQCHHQHKEWHAICPQCDSFATVRWTRSLDAPMPTSSSPSLTTSSQTQRENRPDAKDMTIDMP
ncbi:MAG: hypothetical protein GDA54_04905 [Alphaproteobacteria bacterium GM7ARS4]|nr:hypothetical protein [Alphaproteobacteria bacterium GM7ARS4]